MMRPSSHKAVKHLLRFIPLRLKPAFRWNDFIHPSTLQLSPLLELLLEPLGGKENCGNVELGLHEALVNAVVHGNSGDPAKSIRIRRILTPNWLIWQIQDEGEGVPSSARDGSLPAELDSNTGRGLFLIYQCFDDVRWSRRGNRLQLASRRLSSLNGVGIQDHLFHD